MARAHLPKRDPGGDSGLVHRAQNGERLAFELLFRRHRDSVRAQARRILRDTEDAEDAVQETFVKAFRAIASFDAERPLLPWLMRICRNCCMDALRERRRGGDCIDWYEKGLGDDRIDIESGVASRQEAQTVQQAIERLPDHYRDIVLMRHYGDMEVNEIADALHRPEGTVKSWLFRARALLREDLAVAMSA